ncbi:putative gustatory receptor 98b [Bactrocera neohumeralis]|uniref:putative gustatory receptor 98b n=1 Tax=Bactrocera tryoni TaxID=59916 RepID=UPI001A978371|nr:putative gustatory receptor 98b [Bactrocera tryoni]XP_050334168.1 putative gustatory receptor 98b [Bactrocera neohumeralis]
MRPVKFAESALIAVITPYLWTFSLFAVVMPPFMMLRRTPSDRLGFCIIFVIYILFQLTASVWMEYFNSVMIGRFVYTNSMDSMTYILSLGINIVQLIVQTVIYTQALTGYQQLRSILDSVNQLESDIRQHCAAVPTLYSMRWRFHLRIDIWLLIVCVFLPPLTYALATTTLTTLSKFIIVFCSVLIQMKGIEYCISVQMIQELLHLVQQQLIHLKRELVRCERMELRCCLFTELQANQKLLARIWDLLNQVERYFCIPLCMLFFYNGFLMTQTIHWGYINFKLDDFMLRLCRISYIVLLIISLFIPCYRSQCCIDEYNRFGTILHKLKTVGIDEQLNMRVQEYSLQLMHQKMLFTCGGLFDINLKNFGATILTIATYIVILIQFKLQAETGRKSRIEARIE